MQRYKAIYMSNKLKYIGIIVCLGLAFILVGCQVEEELEFETIELDDHPDREEQYWWDLEPGMIIVANNSEVEYLRQYLSEEQINDLYALDYERYFVLCAFRGYRSTAHAGFHIKNVIRTREHISINSAPGSGGLAASIASPYHCILIPKEREWNQEIVFKMFFRGTKEVSEVKHFIP
jgi:hypothetical protein